MRSFPSEKALVTAYWRKLARSNGAAHKARSRFSAEHPVRRLRARHHGVSRRRTGVAAG